MKRLGLYVQYDLEESITLNKKKLHFTIKAIFILKNFKEYNFFEGLKNSNANISFQILSLSPTIRRLCNEFCVLGYLYLMYLPLGMSISFNVKKV